MGTTARLRDRPVLDAQIAALRLHIDDRPAADDPGDTTSALRLGALDALVWITGGGPAPLTGALAVAPVTLELIVAELATAQDILYGRRPSRRRDYACGVEHALMWAQHATATPPLPPRAGPTRRAMTPNPGAPTAATPRH